MGGQGSDASATERRIKIVGGLRGRHGVFGFEMGGKKRLEKRNRGEASNLEKYASGAREKMRRNHDGVGTAGERENGSNQLLWRLP